MSKGYIILNNFIKPMETVKKPGRFSMKFEENKRSKLNPLLSLITLVEERRIIANDFNNYFTSIASKLNESENGLLIEPLSKYTDYVKNSVESSIFLADS